MDELNEADKDFLYIFFSKDGVVESFRGEDKDVIFVTKPNILQSVLKEANRVDWDNKGLKKWMDIFMSDYQDILFKDVTKIVGEMNIEFSQNYFVYLYENKEYQIFRLFGEFTDCLNTTQQEIALLNPM